MRDGKQVGKMADSLKFDLSDLVRAHQSRERMG